ncbi:MAG: carbohydrate kinase family protein [Candidatus Hydrothermarchaeota archaeon]
MKLDIIFCGHITRDIIEIENEKNFSIGGSVTYGSLCASNLGLRCGIVSKVGRDFALDEFISRGIDVEGVKKENQTTTFINFYDKNFRRTQRVMHKCTKIKIEDFPERYKKINYIHLCPVLDEISLGVFQELGDKFISLDPQGFFRKIEKNSVVSKKWEDMDLFLKHVDLIKISDEELRNVSKYEERAVEKIKKYCDLVIVTKGDRGSTIYEKKRIDIPVIPPREVVDPTGAGDVFITGFLYKFIKGEDIEKCGLFASSLASIVLESMGCSKIPTEKEVNSRLEEYLSNKYINL